MLIPLAQTGGGPPKLRPALVLMILPGPYQNLLIAGISTQLHNIEPSWDELIEPTDLHLGKTGLHRASAVRLSYLYAADSAEIIGAIGQLDDARFHRIIKNLTERLLAQKSR